ncbi:MAG TPA: DUF2474 family protein [Telluria sp.]
MRTRLWLRRFGWLVALWAGSVLALAALAALIRVLMTAAGLRS